MLSRLWKRKSRTGPAVSGVAEMEEMEEVQGEAGEAGILSVTLQK